MLEFYVEMMDRACPPQIVQTVRALDLQVEGIERDVRRMFQELSGGDAGTCYAAYVGYMGSTMNRRTPGPLKSTFMSAAIRVDSEYRETVAPAVAQAWRFISFDEADATRYFRMAGLYRLQLPPSLHDHYAHLTIVNHTDVALAYDEYRLLLADPHVQARLSEALDRIAPDVDTLYGVLSSLIDVGFLMRREGRDTRPIRDLIGPHQADGRRATGVSGPGSGGSIESLVVPALQLFAQLQ